MKSTKLQSDFTPDSILTGLLLLIHRLDRGGQSLGRETILPLAELKLPQVAQTYDSLIVKLVDQELIEGDAERFVLCPDGMELVHKLSERVSLHALFYNQYYKTVLQSRAHSLFCERVYGKDLGQHGMADMEQLDALIDELQIKPGMALLDFGCGDGQIAEHIGDTTRATVTGVDIANEAIQLAEIRTRAKSDRVKFCVVDLEGRLETLSENRFDRIYAVDSLFFVPDQLFVTRRLLRLLKPDGRMGVFYICRPELGTAETPFAQALTNLGVSYRVRDFSEQNAAHWKKKKQVLLELEGMFEAEGSEFLFRNRLAECVGLEHFHRYLYLTAGA